MYSSTLVPYSDATSDSPAGSFGVVIGPTTDLSGSDYTADWNYNANKWDYHYEYSITSAPSDGKVTIYLYEVTANLGRTVNTVGMYVDVDSFGSISLVSQPNS